MLKIKDIYEYKMAKFMYLFNANILPNPISEMLTMNTEIHYHFNRNRKNPHIQYRRTQIASKTLRHQGPIFWYKIPSEIKAKQTVKSFGYCLKRNIVETYPISWINLLLILDCDFAFLFYKIRIIPPQLFLAWTEVSLMSQLQDFRFFQNVYVFSYLSSEFKNKIVWGGPLDWGPGRQPLAMYLIGNLYVTCYANYDILYVTYLIVYV